jgi:NADH dehydrogenase
MSALNADPGATSVYLKTKGEAERIVRDSGLAWTIFRPSVIFGRGDSFLNLFARLLGIAPVLPLACPGARFQPVFVEDVARAFEAGLEKVESFGKSYDLCGPKIYTLRELVEYVGAVTGKQRTILGLSDNLSYSQALMMEMFPFKQILRALGMLMTRDNYYSMKVDNVCGCEFPFGITPTALEAVAPTYLGQSSMRSRFQDMRERVWRQPR